MLHCVQINIGNKPYQFNIDINKEADLTASFYDIFRDYISKSKDEATLAELKEALKTDNFTFSVDLKNLVGQDVLNKDDVSNILHGYLGNTNIYNLVSYLHAYKVSDKLKALINVMSNKGLNEGPKLNSYTSDVLLVKGAKNRIVLNNDRTVLIVNPDSQESDLSSIFTTLYAINHLKEPNSKLFKQFNTYFNEHTEEIPKNLNNLSIDTFIYALLSPDLSDSARETLNEFISQDINNKMSVLDALETKSSMQENILFDILYKGKEELVKIGDDYFPITEIVDFKNSIKKSLTWIPKEDFLNAMYSEEERPEEIDKQLYPNKLWPLLVKNKKLTNALYSNLYKTDAEDKIEDRLNNLCLMALSEHIKPVESNLTFKIDPKSVNIEEGTSFAQNRLVKIRRHNNSIYDNALIIEKTHRENIENTTSVLIPFANINKQGEIEKAINKQVKEIKKVNANSAGIYNLKIERPYEYTLDEIETILKKISESSKINLSHLIVEDSNPRAIQIIKLADKYGFQISLYASEQATIDSIVNKYSRIMPIKKDALKIKYKPYKYQTGILEKLTNSSSVLIPVQVNDRELGNYLKGETLLMHDESSDKDYPIEIEDKIPLFYQEQKALNNGNFEVGDLLVNDKGNKYLYVGKAKEKTRSGENSLLCINLNAGSEGKLIHVNPKSLRHELLGNKYKKSFPIASNNGQVYIWFKYNTAKSNEHIIAVNEISGQDIFENTEYDSLKTDKEKDNYAKTHFKVSKEVTKVDFFGARLEEFAEGCGTTVAQIEKIINNKNKQYLYKVKQSESKPVDVVDPVKVKPKYYSNKDLIERFNSKLPHPIEVVWFNSKSTIADNGISGRTYKDVPAMTINGVIYMNEDFCQPTSFVHELSHVILAIVRNNDYDKYLSIVNNIKEIPESFANKYKGLAQSDLKEEYLVYLFTSYFTDINPNELSNTLKTINWDKQIGKLFNLPSDVEIVNLMNKTIGEVLKASKSNMEQLFKNESFQRSTRLAALKQKLINNQVMKEVCK